MKKTYKIEVDCANCANLMEDAARKTAGVQSATVNFMTQKMIVEFAEGQEPNCHSTGTIIHMAINGAYAGHIVISDIVKPHSKDAISSLKAAGVEKTVMLTGDAKKVADQVATSLGIDKVYSELLPADKVSKVEELLHMKTGKTS